jgi:hypothetical protein
MFEEEEGTLLRTPKGFMNSTKEKQKKLLFLSLLINFYIQYNLYTKREKNVKKIDR